MSENLPNLKTGDLRFGTWTDEVPETGEIGDKLARTAVGKFLVPVYILVVLALIGIAFHFTKSFAAFGGLTWMIIGFGHFVKRSRAPAYLARLLDLPVTLPTFPVVVKFQYRGLKCWEDEGIVTFDRGYLHFQGIHTSFGILSYDMEPTAKLKQVSYFEKRPGLMGPGGTLSQQTGQVKLKSLDPSLAGVELLLQPYDSLPGLERQMMGKFQGAVIEWQANSSPDITHSSHPPVTVSKGVRQSLRQEILIWISFTFLLLIGALLFFHVHQVLLIGASAAIVAALDAATVYIRLQSFGKQVRRVDALRRKLMPIPDANPNEANLSIQKPPPLYNPSDAQPRNLSRFV